MFRPMLRYRQQIDTEECIRILEEQPRGVLSVLGDDGYPYGMPLNHLYCREDGHLYFHCGKEGHKLDAIAGCDKVSYCVHDEGVRREGQWPLHFRSVIVFGRMRIVDDPERMRDICSRLTRKFTSDEDYLRREMESSFHRVLCLELVPEHISGKKVTES
ncbi:MAG: pyridoxamine 5'-phosphate oxidase family protein [Spirochaetales bacterium]|nr:pyridoxamine 5'-phosphate oxidase family protein [Spirochaetales bacterium]